jgi:hypothetical protein
VLPAWKNCVICPMPPYCRCVRARDVESLTVGGVTAASDIQRADQQVFPTRASRRVKNI